MNTTVSSSLAKLLNGKGFVCTKSDMFWKDGFCYEKKDYHPSTYQDKDNAATISDVVIWIHENHGIWISVDCDCYGDLWYAKLSVASKKNWDNIDLRHKIISSYRKFPNEHKSATEAYESAFKYTLNNLI